MCKTECHFYCTSIFLQVLSRNARQEMSGKRSVSPRIGVAAGALVAASQTTLAQAAGTCLVQLTGYTTALGHWLRGVKLWGGGFCKVMVLRGNHEVTHCKDSQLGKEHWFLPFGISGVPLSAPRALCLNACSGHVHLIEVEPPTNYYW